jgi:hypothetical protein
MSSREKGAWICLVATAAVFAVYFFYMLQLLERGELRPPAVLPALVAAVLAQALIHVGATLAFGRGADGPEDAREPPVVEARSFRAAYRVLAVALVTAIAGALLLVPASPVASYALALMGQFALAALFAGEAARYLVQALGYRPGP